MTMAETSPHGSQASPLTSLRRFRFQKKPQMKFDGENLDDSGNITDKVVKRGGRFMIIESSDDDRSPVKNSPNAPVGLVGLINTFPKVNPQIIEKYLIESRGDVEKTAQIIRQGHWGAFLAKQQNSLSDATCKRKLSPEENGSKKVKKFKKIKRAPRDDSDDFDSGDDGNDGYTEEKLVFDSDEDSDTEISNETTLDQQKVLEFLTEATLSELLCMPNISKKKADAIIELQPFDGWRDMVEKFQETKGLGGDILNSAHQFLYTRRVVQLLMEKCSKLSSEIERLHSAGMSAVGDQPKLLNSELKLAGYQMVGLNWLVMLNRKGLNGILADEMGLGKTIQIIAFLAYLKETTTESQHPHLIVVPASTLDNWAYELAKWCPDLKVFTYYGDKEERKSIRIHTMNTGLIENYDVVLTTYNLITSSPEEKKMFRTVRFEYVIFDEAHMLKNMNTARYEQLSNVNAKRRILLTGTPLQNNLLELMSLLTFVMPDLFKNKKRYLRCLFSRNSMKDKQEEQDQRETSLPRFEREQVAQARKIMKPFVLRRLKKDVLTDLPVKTDIIKSCDMVNKQRLMYDNLVKTYAASANKLDEDSNQLSGLGMMMQLRKVANHPLLVRELYQNGQLSSIAKLLVKEPTYKEKNLEYVKEDLGILSDFEIHRLCLAYPSVSSFALKNSDILESGKFRLLDEMLPQLFADNHRLLIFSQFVTMLDILEQYMEIRDYKFLRLDGSTPVPIRQEMIDEFNRDSSISVFLLSTRAGGLGINLTAADTVIIHDLDFNPYNDKQAEDRCHRVGQTKPVTVYRIVMKSSIEEDIHQVASEKLHLEKEISSSEEKEIIETKQLLRKVLGLETTMAS